MNKSKQLSNFDQSDVMGEIITKELKDKNGNVFMARRHYYYTAKIFFKNGNIGYVTNEIYETHPDGYEEPLVLADIFVDEIFEY